MKLHFWGAARTVTGSMHLLEANGRRILFDCGLYQGRRKIAFEVNRTLPFDPRSIDALILSHAHIDHSGNIPNLVKNGFQGPIWCTPVTAELLDYMLRDSAYIQEHDVIYVNKKRRRQGKHPFEPLYTEADVQDALNLLRPVPYKENFQPLLDRDDITAHFKEAGHMLGSASVSVDVTENNWTKRVVFSGDIGRRHLPILRDPEYVEQADYIIMESTYGNREHPPIENSAEDLRQTVIRTHQRGGKIIIPSFAVGRTQELVYALHKLYEANRIPPLDVYVDSPLAVNVTTVFRNHPEVYDAETLKFMAQDEVDNPFTFDHLHYIRDVEKSKRLNSLTDPAVIISASGMCEAGRILHHLKNNVENPKNTILFVGYQAEHTLGRKILAGEKLVPIFGERYTVRAEVHKLEGYSGHADQNGLVRWLNMARESKTPKKVFLVHGEEESSLDLARLLTQQGYPHTIVPQRGEIFNL